MTLSIYARCFGTITLSGILVVLFADIALRGPHPSGMFTFVAVMIVGICAAAAVLGLIALVLAIAENQPQAKQRIRQGGWLLVAGLVLTAYETLIR